MSASSAADRAAILDALTISVETAAGDVTLGAHPAVPSVINPWDGWPVPESTEWANACAAETRWRVYVALPAGDAAAAAAAYDVVHDALGPELAKLGRVDDVTVAAWAVSPTELVPVLQASLTI